MTAAFLLGGAALTVHASALFAQTVDCSGPRGAAEVAVCGSKKLTVMDGELDRAYRAARVRWTASMSNSVEAQYQDWLRERDACGGDEKCLMRRIVEEIRTLDTYRPKSPTWILDVQ